jgi:membrane-associated protease RseP (regulator of RpoE activity)
VESALLYVLGILVVVVGIALSIGLHEIGHLVPAKLFGVKVGQYMIGFGPTIWSRRYGETEYGVKAIPLGGYISMAGMFPPLKPGGAARTASTGFFQTLVQDARDASAAGIRPGEERRVFYKLPVWKRVVVMFGGPFMNLAIAVVLFAVLLMGFGIPQLSTTIGSVSACVLPATSERQACVDTDPLAPGAEAGIRPGDRLVSLNDQPAESWEQATALIRRSPGEPLEVVVDRNGSEVALTVVPLLTERYVITDDGKVATDADGEPLTEKVGFVGIGAATETVRQAPAAVVPMIAENVVGVGNIILHLPQRLVDVWNAAFGTDERDPNGPISVVGVGRLAGEIASIDTAPVVDRVASLVGLVASLNVALFVFNLIPLMPLDGGHIAGALWEGLRRALAKAFKRRDPGPVDTAKVVPLTFAVVVVLGGMSLLLIYADIVKPISVF